MLRGTRVIRGSDWNCGDIDGGEGHVGTVKDEEKDTAQVLWDNGNRSSCRAGKDGKYDLLVFDNGTTGVKHSQYDCSVCSEKEIFGIRWSCSECSSCHLCSDCYQKDRHNINHEFKRYTTAKSTGVLVSKRSISVRSQAMGIFPGAIVVRGENWSWENQDGGDGKTGEVISVEAASKSKSVRNTVRVKWHSSGNTNVYCLGATGRVDLKFKEEARGPFYYRDHLPKFTITQSENSSRSSNEENTIEDKTESFRMGDKVCIMVPISKLEELQKRNGGVFDRAVRRFYDKIGKVTSAEVNEEVWVEFNGQTHRFCSLALKKIFDIETGDTVRIMSNAENVEALQENHGGYNPDMKKFCGKVGQVVKKDSDGDLLVNFGGKGFLYNRACCDPAPGESIYNAKEDSDDDDDDVDVLSGLNKMLLLMMAGLQQGEGLGGLASDGDMAMATLYIAINENDISNVNSIISRNPSLVNKRFRGVTPLILASHEGKKTIVEKLLDKNADINILDHLGNTAVGAALIGKQKDVALFLLERGADASLSDNQGRTALHNAAVQGYHDLVPLCLRGGCDINAQDKAGDTALHDAISAGDTGGHFTKALCDSPNLDLQICNRHGFNALHQAAIKGKARPLEVIVATNKAIVDVKKSDGFSAVHLAAFNDHPDCIRILIKEGKANINCKNLEGDTPLHLAAMKGHVTCAEVLVANGAHVNTTNGKKQTPLHVILSEKKRDPTEVLLFMSLLGQERISAENRVRFAKCLIANGADLNKKDSDEKTPLEVCTGDIKAVVTEIIHGGGSSTSSSIPSSSSLGASFEGWTDNDDEDCKLQ